MVTPMTSRLAALAYDPARGGSRLGWHFISRFKECPMAWYNQYARPASALGRRGVGYEPLANTDARDLGTLVHLWLEHWYKSGWRDGAYDSAYATSALVAHSTTLDLSPALVAEALALVDRHVAYCGPGGVVPEWPDYRVASWTPEGASEPSPLIEHTFEVPLGWEGLIFTSKIDLVVEHAGRLWPWDHKTADASRVAATARQYDIDGQLTGQLWTLKATFPDAPIGNEGLVGILIKRAAAAKPPRMIHTVSRSATDYEVFRQTCVRTLIRMEASLEEHEHLVSTGMSPSEAALLVFDSYPSGFTCAGAFKPCGYYQACLNRDRMDEVLATVADVRTLEGE